MPDEVSDFGSSGPDDAGLVVAISSGLDPGADDFENSVMLAIDEESGRGLDEELP